MAYTMDKRNTKMIDLAIGTGNIDVPNFTPAYNAMWNAVNSHLAKKQDVENNTLETDANILFNYVNTGYANKELYKDKEALAVFDKEVEQKFMDLEQKVANSGLTQAQKDIFYNNLRQRKSFTGNARNQALQVQEVIDQRVNLEQNYLLNFQACMDSAYNGDIDTLNNSVKTLDSIFDMNIQTHNMTPEQAIQRKSDDMSKLMLMTTASQWISAMPEDASPQEKKTYIERCKQQIQDNDFLDMFAKDITDGERHMDKSATETYLHNNVGVALAMFNRELNAIDGSTKNGKIDINNLDPSDQIQFRMLANNSPMEASEFYYNKTGQPIPFKTGFDFYNNSEMQEKFYGKTFNLTDPNDTTIPLNAGGDKLVTAISQAVQQPWNYLQISPEEWDSKTDEEQVAEAVKMALDLTGQGMGTDDIVAQTKFLSGMKVTDKNGNAIPMRIGNRMITIPTDYTTLLGVAQVGEVNRFTTKELIETHLGANDTRNASNLLDSVASLNPAKKTFQEDVANVKSYLEATGQAVRKSDLEGTHENLLLPKQFKIGGFRATNVSPSVQGALNELSEEMNWDWLATQAEMEKFFTACVTNELFLKQVENSAIGFFNSDRRNPYKEQAIQQGITFDMLIKSGAFKKAVKYQYKISNPAIITKVKTNDVRSALGGGSQ